MRALLATAILLSACGGAPGAKAPAAATAQKELPRLVATRVAEGESVTIDGATGDPVWDRAVELVLPLKGPGPRKVHLKAAHDGKRLFLFAIWADSEVTTSRYYEYMADRTWLGHEEEDGFCICWSPGSEAAAFREMGCALFCHDGKHEYRATSNFVDFWSWRVQQTRPHNQARDLWLPAGENQRLRGDSQPEESDNYPNLRDDCFQPKYVPFRVNATSRRFLWPSNVNELPKRWTEKLDAEKNIGWQVPMDILRPMKGSRGDIEASGRHAANAWILELARALRTGESDDQAFGDPLVPQLFSVAIHDGSTGADHSMSAPVELHFEP